MAIDFIGDGQYHGLEADVKVSKPAGSILTITDTGDRFISDGTYWWIMNWPTSLSRYRVGGGQQASSLVVGTGIVNALVASTGIGAPSFLNTDTTNGRYLSILTNGASGNRAGYRYNASTLMARAQNFKVRARFMIPTAPDHTLTRFYIGVSTNQELTGDAPLDGLHGAMVGFLSGGTHYKLFHNDGGATGDYNDDVHTSAVVLDEAIHEIRIVADESVPRISFKWDNNPYVHVTTDIPTSTQGVTMNYQNEANEAAVKTWRLYNYKFECDW